MEYQFRQIKKPIFEVGDRVEYHHQILDLGDITAIVAANIIAIDGDKYRISIPHGTQGSPKQTEAETTVDRLTQLMRVPNPQWLAYQLEKADKISYADWDGQYLFDESSDQYFESFEEFFEWHEDNETDEDNIPYYCFATKPQVFQIDSAEDLCEYWLDEDENLEFSDFEGIEEFQSAIDNFNSTNRKKSYYPDYSTVIKFDGVKNEIITTGQF